jgi:hypothetical protein
MNATLLCVALLVPGYGEKEIKGRIRDAGGVATNSGGIVEMARTTTDADLDELCQLRSLRFLGLSDTKITDKGLQTVSGLRWLKSLDLDGTAVTDDGLRLLESLSNLHGLDLRFCPNLTDEGVARLKKALPNCRILR